MRHAACSDQCDELETERSVEVFVQPGTSLPGRQISGASGFARVGDTVLVLLMRAQNPTQGAVAVPLQDTGSGRLCI